MKTVLRGSFNITSEEEMREFGLGLADAAEAGDIIALIGDLGTGKTALTRYIAEGLGAGSGVVSPTFTIVREYTSGRLPLYHFDVYRLSGSGEFLDAGAEDYLYGDGVCVIEWADIVADALPADSLLICIGYGENECERHIDVL